MNPMYGSQLTRSRHYPGEKQYLVCYSLIKHNQWDSILSEPVNVLNGTELKCPIPYSAEQTSKNFLIHLPFRKQIFDQLRYQYIWNCIHRQRSPSRSSNNHQVRCLPSSLEKFHRASTKTSGRHNSGHRRFFRFSCFLKMQPEIHRLRSYERHLLRE